MGLAAANGSGSPRPRFTQRVRAHFAYLDRLVCLLTRASPQAEADRPHQVAAPDAHPRQAPTPDRAPSAPDPPGHPRIPSDPVEQTPQPAGHAHTSRTSPAAPRRRSAPSPKTPTPSPARSPPPLQRARARCLRASTARLNRSKPNELRNASSACSPNHRPPEPPEQAQAPIHHHLVLCHFTTSRNQTRYHPHPDHGRS